MKKEIEAFQKDIENLKKVSENYRIRLDSVKGKDLYVIKVNNAYSISLDSNNATRLGRHFEAALFSMPEAEAVIKEVSFKDPAGRKVKAEGIKKASAFFESQMMDCESVIKMVGKNLETLQSKLN